MNRYWKKMIAIVTVAFTLLASFSMPSITVMGAEAPPVYQDGEYILPITVLADGTESKSMMDTYVEKPARLKVAGGKNVVTLTLTNSSWIKLLQTQQQDGNYVDVTNVTEDNETDGKIKRVVSFEVKDLTSKLNAYTHVVVPEIRYDNYYNIQFQFDPSGIPLASPVNQDGEYMLPVTVLADGTESKSMMDTYVQKPATLKVTGGKNIVTLTLTSSDWILLLQTQQQDGNYVNVTNVTEDIKKDGITKRVVSFEVKDITTKLNAYTHVVVPDISYDNYYNIQFQFGTPFVPSPETPGGPPTPDKPSVPETVVDFFTSFEADDLQPIENTTEINPNGEKMISGVDGNPPFKGIQGDITRNVEEILANDDNPPDETKDNLIDGNENTKWLAFSSTGWIQLKLKEKDVVTKYALTSADDSPERDPRDWQLSGSNDGEHWTLLDERTDEAFEDRHQQHIYELANNTTPYQYYKLDISKTYDDSDLLQLAEISLSNGKGSLPDPVAMKSYVTKESPWSDLNALTYSGTNTVSGRAFAYNKIYDTDILVTPNTTLSYQISLKFDGTSYSSSYVAVDLLFDDGQYLHELDAVDQYGIKLDPKAQGDSRNLPYNQSSYIESNIGDVAAGKTIKRILIAYDNPGAQAGTTFTGMIDDIRISHDVYDNDAVTAAVAALELGDLSHVTTGVQLPKVGMQGTSIAWKSSDTSVLSDEGKVVSRPAVGSPDQTVVLTATVSKGTERQTKTFEVVVKAWSETDLLRETDFTTGFEAGDPVPAYNSWIDSHHVAEYCCGVGGMESKINIVDPDVAQGIYNSALLYAGDATDAESNYAYNKVFDAAFEIKPSTVLTYRIHPEGPNAVYSNEILKETSQYVSMDILFKDGTYLHDLQAVDQNGVVLSPLAQGGVLKLDARNTVTSGTYLHDLQTVDQNGVALKPQAQGEVLNLDARNTVTSGTYLHDLQTVDQNGVTLNPSSQGGVLKLDTWNTVTSNIGAVAAGKVVDKILIAFNATGHTGKFRGFVDDLAIYHLVETPLSRDATLSQIQIGGVPLAKFDSGLDTYNVVLPAGTRTVPTVSATATDASASVVVNAAGSLPGATTIVVTAEDGSTRLTYKINFTVAASPVSGGGGSGGDTGSSDDGSTSPGGEAIPSNDESKVGEVIIKPEQITPLNGKATVVAPVGTTRVKLPYNTAELLGDSVLEVKLDQVVLDVPSQLIKQLTEALSPADRQGSSVLVQLAPLSESAAKAIVAKGENAAYADIRLVSQVYDLNLSIISKDGREEALKAFTHPITIRLQTAVSVDSKLAAVYDIADNGTLEYMGGEINKAGIVAAISCPGQYAAMELTKKFDDVASSHWAAEVIKVLAAKQMATGVSATKFQPESSVTRAEFAALLVRTLKLKSTGETAFTDVKSDDWYAEAVAIAVKAGIVEGKSATVFDPNASITREEMAAMLMRGYESAKGKAAADSQASFKDEAQVAKWAVEDVNAAASLQLIKGRAAGKFDAKGITTRAEAAQVVHNLLEAMK